MSVVLLAHRLCDIHVKHMATCSCHFGVGYQCSTDVSLCVFVCVCVCVCVCVVMMWTWQQTLVWSCGLPCSSQCRLIGVRCCRGSTCPPCPGGTRLWPQAVWQQPLGTLGSSLLWGQRPCWSRGLKHRRMWPVPVRKWHLLTPTRTSAR